MTEIQVAGTAQSGEINEHPFSIEPWSFGGGWYWELRWPDGELFKSGSEEEEELAIRMVYLSCAECI